MRITFVMPLYDRSAGAGSRSTPTASTAAPTPGGAVIVAIDGLTTLRLSRSRAIRSSFGLVASLNRPPSHFVQRIELLASELGGKKAVRLLPAMTFTYCLSQAPNSEEPASDMLAAAQTLGRQDGKRSSSKYLPALADEVIE